MRLHLQLLHLQLSPVWGCSFKVLLFVVTKLEACVANSESSVCAGYWSWVCALLDAEELNPFPNFIWCMYCSVLNRNWELILGVTKVLGSLY